MTKLHGPTVDFLFDVVEEDMRTAESERARAQKVWDDLPRVFDKDAWREIEKVERSALLSVAALKRMEDTESIHEGCRKATLRMAWKAVEACDAVVARKTLLLTRMRTAVAVTDAEALG